MVIIVKVLVCLLVFGMGDVFFIWFEVKVCYDVCVISMVGGQFIEVVLSFVCLCYDMLLVEGEKVCLVVQVGVVIEVLECIIEVNIYFSGIGFESSGLVVVYVIYNGFIIFEECYYLYYGEKVVFGILVQLVLQNSLMDEIEMVLGFCQCVGLLVMFVQMGVKEGIDEKIVVVVKVICVEGEIIYNMLFVVILESVYVVIFIVDLLGQQWLVC